MIRSGYGTCELVVNVLEEEEEEEKEEEEEDTDEDEDTGFLVRLSPNNSITPSSSSLSESP